MNRTITLLALLCFGLIGFVGCGDDDSGNKNDNHPIDDGTGNECKGAGCALCTGASCAVTCDRTFGEGCKVCTANNCDSFTDSVFSCTGKDCSIQCVDAACSSVKCVGKDCPVINCRTSGCELCSGSSCAAGCFEGECNVCNANTPGNFLGCNTNWGTIYSCSGNDCSLKCENATCSAVKCDGNDCPVFSCKTAGCTLCSGSSCVVGCDTEVDHFCETCPSDNDWTCGTFGTKYGCSGEDCVIKCQNAGCATATCQGEDCPFEIKEYF